MYRSQDERIIAGVCGGLGVYFGMDPVIIRLVMVILALTGGYGIMLYILFWLVVPREL